jgi:hypothetical protein
MYSRTRTQGVTDVIGNAKMTGAHDALLSAASSGNKKAL